MESGDPIIGLWQAQRSFYQSGATRAVSFRRDALVKLKSSLRKWEEKLYDALWTDLHKCREEAYLTEISVVYSEIDYHIKNIGRWTSDRRRCLPAFMLPSSGKIHWEPLGNTLIIAPWNYPVQLLLNPLIGAISAGDTAVLKVSPNVPNVSGTLAEMISDCFEPEYVALVQGHRDVNKSLLNLRWDFIFFTGGTVFGKSVMEAASAHMTPVVLEMGGKSPCIVAKDADVKIAARRIAWGKVVNAGQTCVAPDYAFVYDGLVEQFVKEFKNQVKSLLGPDPQKSSHYGRIVNEKAFLRVKSYIDNAADAAVACTEGVRDNEAERYIAPTYIMKPDVGDEVMNTEIFGPVLPIIPFSDIEEAVSFVNQREKPLAMYIFSSGKTARDIVSRTTSGGACINDTIMHVVGDSLPFGGVGYSGMGNYHGRRSFEAFSHERSVLTTPTCVDLPFRYMPYKLIGLVKMLLKN